MSKWRDDHLIKCKHGRLLWKIVCIHLIKGKSLEWCAVAGQDWLCPECMCKDDRQNIANLRPVCIRCVGELRAKFDRNYEPEKEVTK
jgi:hypothetical protein